MSDVWFENAVAPDGVVEDGCHLAEAQSMKSYLRDQIDVHHAAQQITRPTDESNDLGFGW